MRIHPTTEAPLASRKPANPSQSPFPGRFRRRGHARPVESRRRPFAKLPRASEPVRGPVTCNASRRSTSLSFKGLVTPPTTPASRLSAPPGASPPTAPRHRTCSRRAPAARETTSFVSTPSTAAYLPKKCRQRSHFQETAFAEFRSPVGLTSTPEQNVPRAPKGRAQPRRRGDQNIRLSRLDLLKRSDIEVRHFSQRFLCHSPGHALAAQICAKRRKCFGYGIPGHALSCRRSAFD